VPPSNLGEELGRVLDSGEAAEPATSALAHTASCCSRAAQHCGRSWPDRWSASRRLC
jgi:hypothetical protein